MNIYRSAFAAALLLPALASQAVTTAEFASKAPAAPVTSAPTPRPAAAATTAKPASAQRQADDKTTRSTPSAAAPKPVPR